MRHLKTNLISQLIKQVRPLFSIASLRMENKDDFKCWYGIYVKMS